MNAQARQVRFVGIPQLFVVLPSGAGVLALIFCTVGVIRAGTTPGFAVLLIAIGTVGGVVLGLLTTTLILAFRFPLLRVIRGSAVDIVSALLASFASAALIFGIVLNGQSEWSFTIFLVVVGFTLAIISIGTLAIVRYRASKS